MEKNDLSTMRVDNDRLTSDLERLKQRLREEITRTQAGVRLDLNLEKGRMRESSTGQELKIKEVDTRIEKEISELRTSIQASKVLPIRCCLSYTLTEYLSPFIGCYIAISCRFRCVLSQMELRMFSNYI